MAKEHDGVAAFYDATAESWADSWYGNESMLPFLKEFLATLPPRPRVLDLGCGAGYESMRLRKLGADVVGVDLSEASIAIARERNPDIPFHVMNMLALDASLGAFDGIVAMASMIHLDDAQQPTVFAQVAQHLKPGGQCWTVFIAGDGYDEKRSRLTVDGVEHDRRFYRHQPEAMDAAAKGAGLKALGAQALSEEDAGYGWVCRRYRA